MSERLGGFAQTVPSFSKVFSPLADHFFPDGCPLISIDGDDSIAVDGGEGKYLQDAWPLRSAAQRRETISAEAALQAISHIQDYAESYGLTPAEMVAVAFVAMAMLSIRKNAAGTVVRSPLQDGTAAHFVTLIHSLLPKMDNESSDNFSRQDTALPVIFSRLLVAGCCFRDVPEKGGAQHEIRQSVLRFLLLAKLYCYRESELMENCLPWTVVFQWALHPKTAPDALRLLWHAALPIPMFRLKQLERFHRKLLAAKNDAVAATVAALLARYNGNPTQPETVSLKGATGDWKDFPDAEWEKAFSGDSPRRRGIVFHIFDDVSKMPDTRDVLRTQHQNNSNEAHRTKPYKRRRLSTKRDLQPICSYIRRLISATLSTHDKIRFRKIQEHSLCVATSTAVEISEDPFLQHLFALGVHKSAELHVRNVLPHKLHDQWYDGESATMHSARCRILSSLADWGIRSGSITDEVQAFVRHHVLAFWDGIVDNDLGKLLLFGVLPFLCPAEHRADSNTVNVEYPISLIDELERFTTPWSKHLRYMAVSGTFSDLIFRWYIVNFPSSGDLDDGLVSGFGKLVRRVEGCILNGFLNTDENDEFLRAAAMDLHDAVCDIHTSRSPPVLPRVHAPSSSLLHQLLLSSSCLNVDRACAILLRYNCIFQSWIENVLPGVSDSPGGPFHRSEGLKKIRSFRSFVETFHSVLWDAFLSRTYSMVFGSNNIDSADGSSLLVRHVRRNTKKALNKANGSRLSLNITRGATFAQIAFDFVDGKIERQMKGDQGSSSLGQVRRAVKLQYLQYLEERGFNGLHMFLSRFAKTPFTLQEAEFD